MDTEQLIAHVRTLQETAWAAGPPTPQEIELLASYYPEKGIV